jgi:L-aspartate oxidase
MDTPVEQAISEIQDLMWRAVGIVRTGNGLKKAIDTLAHIAPRVAHPRNRRAHEARNLQLVGSLVARSAIAREESRGAHYRIDYPAHDDAKFLKHSVIEGESVRFE